MKTLITILALLFAPFDAAAQTQCTPVGTTPKFANYFAVTTKPGFVWTSQRNLYVPTSDADYVTFLANGCFPTGAATEEVVWGYLSNRNPYPNPPTVPYLGSEIAIWSAVNVDITTLTPGTVLQGRTLVAGDKVLLTLQNNITRNGTLSSGSAIVTALATTADLVVGMQVEGTGITSGGGSSNTVIKSIDSGTQITLSQNATASGVQSLTFGSTAIASSRTLNGVWTVGTPPTRDFTIFGSYLDFSFEIILRVRHGDHAGKWVKGTWAGGVGPIGFTPGIMAWGEMSAPYQPGGGAGTPGNVAILSPGGLLVATQIPAFTGDITIAAGTTVTAYSVAPWTGYTPSLSCGSGSLTTSSASGAYKTIGKTFFVAALVTITTNGTCAANLRVSLPFTGQRACAWHATDFAINNKFLHGRNTAGANLAVLYSYDGTYPAVDGMQFVMSGVCEST